MRKICYGLVGLFLAFNLTQVFAADVTIYLTRHGKTMFNTVKRAQGWSDTPLTPDGVAVAKALGKGLKNIHFSAVYSSDSGRARETAYLIVTQGMTPLSIQEREGLREVCFGTFEGNRDSKMWGAAAKYAGYNSVDSMMKSFAAGKESFPQMIDAIAGAEPSGTAENYRTVSERMMRTVTALAQESQAKGERNILVVSHGMSIGALLSQMGYKLAKPLENASVTKLRFTDDHKLVIESVNDMSYVERGKVG